jgi:hypothetical protein
VKAADDLLALVAEVAELAAGAGRSDLAERADARRRTLAAPDVLVVVAGEFKAGKSSLVNALVDADVCPVDDDIATAVPTLVRFAAEPGFEVRRAPEDDRATGNGHGDRHPLDRLADFATEQGDPANRDRVRALEVGIPSALLRDGLVLVDTPGVGGLGSTYASATMTALAMAHAVVFVSDASQEYTGPELEFLAAARQACPDVLPVLTKVDVVPDWRTIRDRNEGWLEGAGLPGEVVPISAALRIEGRRRDRGDLREESGLDEVVTRLGTVAERFRRTLAVAAAEDVRAVVGQLAAPLRAEQAALADPVRTIEALAQAAERAEELTGDHAEWVALLDEGMVDIEDEIDADLARRMKGVLTGAGQTVRSTDPAASWDEFEAALTRQVGAEISTVAVGVNEAAHRLAERLARHFAEHEAAVAPSLSSSALPDLHADAALVLGAGATRWRGVLVDAGWGGLEALGVLGSILTFTSISVFNPFALVVGALIGGKSLRDSRRRELERRREQAVEAVGRYVQDAGRAAERELKATTRRIRRELRTGCQRRADALHRSARESLVAAERIVGTDETGREERRRQVVSRLGELESLDRRADELAAALRPAS